MIGYTADRPLHRFAILEPSFGRGDFLLPIIRRLLESRANALAAGEEVRPLSDCLRAVELHEESLLGTRAMVVEMLAGAGLVLPEARSVADAWLIHGDFLLADIPQQFAFIVGNPPYVRQELIPPPLLNEYRRRFATLYDRADLYVPFIERSLGLLADGGELCFICSDR